MKSQPKKFWNYFDKKVMSTETIPTFKLGNDKCERAREDKVETLSNFLISAFTMDTTSD